MATDETFFKFCLILFFLISPTMAIITLCFGVAPHGRKKRQGLTGRTIPAPLAWFLFESPTLWLTTLLFPLGKNHSNPKAMIHMSFYLIHYVHRTLIYPIMMLLKNPSRKLKACTGYPIRETVFGFVFNLLNAYLQVRSVSEYTTYEGHDNWFWWRLAVGLVIYVMGMAINVRSDYALLSLKRQGGGGYKIPRGGLFELVSSPNYFGEIIEWLGLALITCSWASFGFFLTTFACLMPGGVVNHKWYLDKFGEDYPKNRKAVILFVF